MVDLREIISRFDTLGGVRSVAPLGRGLINDTYRVDSAAGDAPDYVLQRINHAVFRDVDALQNNLRRITNHIRAQLTARGEQDIDRKVLRMVSTRDGRLSHFDDQNHWRMTELIPGAVSYSHITPELARRTGRAFGDFQKMMVSLPDEPLSATIPDFHNIEFRLGQLREAVREDRVGRVKEMQPVIERIEVRADVMCALPAVPRRTAHCDTKVDNVLFDDATGEVLCVIDLDTTMPGYAMSDFGDFIRTAANTGAEDDPNPADVGVDMAIFRAFASGYMETAEAFLTPTERESLVFGARLLTYMQAVRFLTDYLNGDIYYKVAHPEHNRNRTIAQMAMLKSIEEHETEMKRYIG